MCFNKNKSMKAIMKDVKSVGSKSDTFDPL